MSFYVYRLFHRILKYHRAALFGKDDFEHFRAFVNPSVVEILHLERCSVRHAVKLYLNVIEGRIFAAERHNDSRICVLVVILPDRPRGFIVDLRAVIVEIAGKIFSVINSKYGFIFLIVIPLGLLIVNEISIIVKAFKEDKEEHLSE